MKELQVKHCTECPFRQNESEAMRAHCAAAEYRALSVDTRTVPKPLSPPKWCPLRSGGVIVCLGSQRFPTA